MKHTILYILAGFTLLTSSPCILKAQTITTIAGSGIGDDSIAAKGMLNGPVGVAIDNAGNTYIGDQGSNRLRKISSSGIITTIAGNGIKGHTGDGGPAINAKISSSIYGVTADNSGNVYFIESDRNYIRKINAAGIITTIAGDGTTGYSGDGGQATDAQLNNPTDIVVDAAGNVIFADWLNNVVRKITPAGIISTIVGTGSISGAGNGGPATASELGRPFRVAMDNAGNLYVASVIFQCICKVDTHDTITIIGGTGAYAIGPDGDGGPATAATMTSPCGLALDQTGNLYFSDIGNHRVRKIDMNTGIISNYAGNSAIGAAGDGGPAIAAELSTLEALACNANGDLLICDADNNKIRIVDHSSKIISTFSGQNGLFEEGYAAVSTKLSNPNDVTTDAAGNIYISDMTNHRIRKIDAANGTITTIAGSGVSGYDNSFSGDGGPAVNANVFYPSGVAVAKDGTLYFCDQSNQRIRKVGTDGTITTIAGNGSNAFGGDNGPAINAKVNYPRGIITDDAGNIYFCDRLNNRVRKINTAGIITTIAGTGGMGYAGDAGPATTATLNEPIDLSMDSYGRIYICDLGNYCIRMIDTTGNISTVAGNGTSADDATGGSAIHTSLSLPFGMHVDAVGNIFIADYSANKVKKVSIDGVITTVAGTGVTGFAGDGGPAVSALLQNPTSVTLDGAGNLLICDFSNNRIRKVEHPLGIKNINRAITGIEVFPNPATKTMHIVHADNCDLVLIDALGKKVWETHSNRSSVTMDISSVANGMYILCATQSNGEKSTVKITKQ